MCSQQPARLNLHTQLCCRQRFGKTPTHFITFNLHLATSEPPTPLPVTFMRNLRSLSPSHLTSVVSSFLPSPTHFSATDTLCSTLSSCLDIYVLSPPGQHMLPLQTHGYAMFFVNIGPNSGQLRDNGTNEYLSVFAFIFLCWSPHCQDLILPQQDQQRIWHTQSPNMEPWLSDLSNDYRVYIYIYIYVFISWFIPLKQTPFRNERNKKI